MSSVRLTLLFLIKTLLFIVRHSQPVSGSQDVVYTSLPVLKSRFYPSRLLSYAAPLPSLSPATALFTVPLHERPAPCFCSAMMRGVLQQASRAFPCPSSSVLLCYGSGCPGTGQPLPAWVNVAAHKPPRAPAFLSARKNFALLSVWFVPCHPAGSADRHTFACPICLNNSWLGQNTCMPALPLCMLFMGVSVLRILLPSKDPLCRPAPLQPLPSPVKFPSDDTQLPQLSSTCLDTFFS